MPVTKSVTTGRAVMPISVAPRTSAQRETLQRAAKAAGVSLSYYLLESALMVADKEGFHCPPTVDGWRPGRGEGDPQP